MFNIKRKYKEKRPLETINLIRGLLSSYGVFTREDYWGNPYENICSVSIVSGDEFGQFRTNGKSQSQEYCLASAYGEFMERIQNNMHVLNVSHINLMDLKNKSGVYAYPDEELLGLEDILNLPENVLQDLFGRSDYVVEAEEYVNIAKSRTGKGCVCVPYYCVNSQEVLYLPYNLLLSSVGSNGMAAGNTLEEALCQGLFEVIERLAASLIFYNQLTPPDIPSSYLQQFPREFGIIKQLESDSFQVVMKDFSCGIGLPALGALLVEPSENTYFLNVGCDSSFQVALSRCLTELYQGVSNPREMRLRMMRLPSENPWYFEKEGVHSGAKRESVFCQYTVNGCGKFPKELFGHAPTYSFKDSVFATSTTYASEVKYWIQFLMELGYTVLVRNVSFLGFPSIHVYIPQVSSVGLRATKKNYDFQLLRAIDLCLEACCSRKELNKEEYAEIANNLATMSVDMTIFDLFSLQMKGDPDVPVKYVGMLELLCWVFARNVSVARERTHIRINETESSDCHAQLLIMLDALDKDSFYENVGGNLGYYGKVLSKTLEGNDVVLEEVMGAAMLPTCPLCGKCPVNDHCLTQGKLKLAATLMPKYSLDHRSLLVDQITHSSTQAMPVSTARAARRTGPARGWPARRRRG
ncbi:YcaO-like family protein [Oceanidesulfovibrio marinus]|uniref:YcaO domain-containing protein n=1 Tax=Oceanidesulfovibrio marinus TaxID=370038 RepID=A0ABX6NKT8_9BACT|nr:YcaO-like family protein [Oceanidesulfovibrio marinus]QJT10734.1 hypothetical protein E8L03_18215 [Oceanidesulfovibrio marinus]